jgi:hypothetical protein
LTTLLVQIVVGDVERQERFVAIEEFDKLIDAPEIGATES